MLLSSYIAKKLLRAARAALLACAAGILCAPVAARADALPLSVSPLALQQALDASDHVDLYTPQNGKGFNLGSSYFSGPASGAAASGNVVDFANDQRLYALLIDGRYDFNYETPTLSSPLRPYISGGMGMAAAGYTGNASLTAGSGEMVPLFRLGGGVAYRLDPRWDLSLDYKTGVAAPMAGDQVFTGRGNQAVDLQTLNLGMRYAF